MTAAVISIKKEANVKQKVNFVRNIALALCVVGALVFGATQAWAYTTCLMCNPQQVECAEEGLPDVFCQYKCEEWSCMGGECHIGVGNSECRCFYK